MKSEKCRPRALDLNAPILSTRRPPQPSCCIRRTSTRRGVSDGIPFSWEQAPGKPKKSIDGVTTGDSPKEAHTPRPRPPPQLFTKLKGYGDHDGGDISSLDNEEDVFSNAVDVFSLSEAMDIIEREERPIHGQNDNIDQLNLKIAGSCREDASPNFMINRFLPDASAWAWAAASSALTNHHHHHHPSCCEDETKDLNCCKRQLSSSSRYKGQEVVSSRRSSTAQAGGAQKGCGMENLFLWRIKPKFCGDHKTCHVRPFSTAKPKNT